MYDQIFRPSKPADPPRRRPPAGSWVLIVSVVVAGYALQRVAPEARSIDGVIEHFDR